MKAAVCWEGDRGELMDSLHTFIGENPELSMVFLMVGEHTTLSQEDLLGAAQSVEIPLAGAIFPGVIYGTKHSEAGVVMLGCEGDAELDVIRKMDVRTDELPERLNQINDKWRRGDERVRSIFVVVDGLASCVSELTFEIFNTFGDGLTHLGCGAGSLSLVQKPTLFTVDGFFEGGAILIKLSTPAHLGVAHGWTSIFGPVVATRVDRKIIRQLNWMPAFEVYRDTVERYSDKRFGPDNFFDISKAFPFGIARSNGEFVVRDPIEVDDEGCLICVGEVPENAVLHILHGEAVTLIEAGRIAAARAAPQGVGIAPAVCVIDCISRSLFLGDRLKEAYEAIEIALPPGAVMAGAMTLGEIASPEQEFVDFHNKTIVVASFET